MAVTLAQGRDNQRSAEVLKESIVLDGASVGSRGRRLYACQHHTQRVMKGK